jgi:replicative DNA helicase
VVLDSLHKLPFRDLSERRTGIDFWLRQCEAIRDEEGADFLIISELSRDRGGNYGEKPDFGLFQGLRGHCLQRR